MSNIPANVKIENQLDPQLVNSGIELVASDEFDDMLLIYGDLKEDKFVGGADHEEYDKLNYYYGYRYKRKRSDVVLFSFAIVEHKFDTYITLYVPHIWYYSWGDPDMTRQSFVVKLENAAECIKLVNDYCLNNPILYTIEALATYDEELYKSDIVKVMLKKAESEFSELELLIQAANI